MLVLFAPKERVVTTESSELKRLVPVGEPFTDLLDELAELGRRSNSTGGDWIPIDQFYIELNRISAEACRRKGEQFYPMPQGGIPPVDYIPSDEDLEEALAFWMITKAKAANPAPGRSYTTEEAFAEFEDEIGPYDPDEDIDLGPGWVKDSA